MKISFMKISKKAGRNSCLLFCFVIIFYQSINNFIIFRKAFSHLILVIQGIENFKKSMLLYPKNN